MSIIRMFSGAYCHAEEVGAKVVESLGGELLDDEYVLGMASERFGVARNKLKRTLAGRVSAFNDFTHERQRNTSYLKRVVAELMARDDYLLSGSSSQLVPAEITHVMSVCIIADFDDRCRRAMEERDVSKREAQRIVQKEDEGRILWTNYVLGKDPWDSDLYDLFIPTNQVPVDDAVQLIVNSVQSDALRPTETSLQAVKDFRVTAEVEIALGKVGHDVAVSTKGGKVTLTINKHALMLSRLEEELKTIAAGVEEVREVDTKVGPGFYQPTVYRQLNLELPSKVLLVDDEREFVQTLSERIQMRDMGSTVVYNGHEALSFVEEEEPEVIVLDLKMPGIDGIEVLRRIKRDHPGIEVIVLTGHGSEKDEETCMKLGAFAYLQKPVDVDKLSETMQQAYRKVRAKTSRSDVDRGKEGT